MSFNEVHGLLSDVVSDRLLVRQDSFLTRKVSFSDQENIVQANLPTDPLLTINLKYIPTSD